MTKTGWLFLILLCFAARAEAQTVRGSFSSSAPLSSAQGNPFSSIEGRYQIALPKQIGGFSEGTFEWRLREGYFTVGYRDYASDIEASKDAAAESRDQAQKAITDFNRWLLETPVTPVWLTPLSIKLDNHSGVELRAEMPNGLAIARSFPVKKRIYSLAVILVGEQKKNEAQALQVFDSFRVIPTEDAEAILRQKIAAAMPKPLPQEPVVAKARSDAEDENLKGKVKAVVEEVEGLSGSRANQPRRMSSELSFNEKGNRLTNTVYNSAGLPFDFNVYGYIDGKRVVNWGEVFYESSPGGIGIGTSAEAKPRDPRYAMSYVYKYDNHGKLLETLLYGNNGDSSGRITYKYSDHQVETIRYLPNGQVSIRSVAVLDESGNEIERTYFDLPLKGWNQIYRYSYEFDAQGNWTKRVATYIRVREGTAKEDSTYVTYRRITYY